MQHAFSVRSLRVETRGKTLLHIDALDLPAHACTAVIGPNGAGKSTLLKALLGQGGRGEISLFGQDAAPQIRQGRVAWVGQHGRYQMPFSVREYIALARSTASGRLKGLHDADWLLDYFDLAHLADKRIHRLSGGEQQRANIIRALLQNAPVLLLDEPCNHLDIRHQHKLMQYLHEHSGSFTPVMVLHDLNLAARYAQHIVLLDQGRVAAAGTPDEVLREDLLQAVYRWSIRRQEHENGLFFSG